MNPNSATIPPVTKFLLMANAAVFLFGGILMPVLGGGPATEAFYFTFGLLPVDFWNGAIWQPVTSMFLHGGFLHILMNMIALWSLGMLLEQAIGSRPFAYLYAVAGLAGGLFVAFFQSGLGVPTVGASGAISGMLGAIALLFPESRLLFFIFPVKARTAAIVFGLLSLVFSFAGGGNISHVGHLGGLVGGLAYTYFALRPGRASPRRSYDFGANGFDNGGPRINRGSAHEPRHPAQTTYYDPVRGVFFTKKGPATMNGAGFSDDQTAMMRRIQRILRGGRPADDEGDNDGVRFFRPGPRGFYH